MEKINIWIIIGVVVVILILILNFRLKKSLEKIGLTQYSELKGNSTEISDFVQRMEESVGRGGIFKSIPNLWTLYYLLIDDNTPEEIRSQIVTIFGIIRNNQTLEEMLETKLAADGIYDRILYSENEDNQNFKRDIITIISKVASKEDNARYAKYLFDYAVNRYQSHKEPKELLLRSAVTGLLYAGSKSKAAKKALNDLVQLQKDKKFECYDLYDLV